MMFKSFKHVVLAATILALAILPSVASARVDPPGRSYSDAPAAVGALMPGAAHQAVQASVSGFSWHDAGFGAAGMLVVLGLASGTVLTVRRRASLG